MHSIGAGYLCEIMLSKMSIKDYDGHFELKKSTMLEAHPLIHNGDAFIIGMFVTSFDVLIAVKKDGYLLINPFDLSQITEPIKIILCDEPTTLVCSTDKSALHHIIAFHIDDTDFHLNYVGVVVTHQSNGNAASLCASSSVVTHHIGDAASSSCISSSDDILKSIAISKMKQRKPKSSLKQVFFGDKLLKQRAANEAAYRWILYHAPDFAKIDKRDTNNSMKQFKVFRKNKWMNVKTLQECLNLVMQHCKRDFFDDMKTCPEKYGLTFKTTQFVDSHPKNSKVSMLDSDDEQHDN